jgi:hypothetical protein
MLSELRRTPYSLGCVVRFTLEERRFSLLQNFRAGSEAYPPDSQLLPMALPPGVKQPLREGRLHLMFRLRMHGDMLSLPHTPSRWKNRRNGRLINLFS